MTDIPIPPEAVEAALLAWIGSEGTIAEGMSHALRAGLAAWPGMSHAHNEEGEIKDWATWYALPWHRAEISNGIILPLTENSNDKG